MHLVCLNPKHLPGYTLFWSRSICVTEIQPNMTGNKFRCHKATIVFFFLCHLKDLVHIKRGRADSSSSLSWGHQSKAASSEWWIYHALNMSSLDLKYTSPLIASASLAWAFNQTLSEQFPSRALSSIFPQLFGVLILKREAIGFTPTDLISCLQR